MTIVEFRFEAAEDDSVDSQYLLFVNNVDSRIRIQDSRSYRGGWGLNRYHGEGHNLSSENLGRFSSLKAAKAQALSLVVAD